MSADPIIIGRYALCDELARGGMATVHIGRLLGPAGFARTVAIKRLHPHLAQDPAFVAMLLDEARLAARIQHPNVAATLDVVAKDGELFVVMEYLHGETLSRLLRAVRARKTHVPPAIASAIMIGALAGLHAAHEAHSDDGTPLELIHRDISPQNIMVRRDGTAVVVDFGVAKAAGRFHNTEQGQVKGKLPYMAPEQVRGAVLTRGVDIYAAAAVLWETLTSERLIAGSNEGEVLEKLLFSNLAKPSDKVAGIPPTLDDVVMQGLSRDRDKRYATAREMALALEEGMAPATPSRVSAWLEDLVGDVLTEREARVAALESSKRFAPTELGTGVIENLTRRGADATQEDPSHPSSASRTPAAATPQEPVSTASQVTLQSDVTPSPPARKRSWLFAGSVGAAVLIAGGAWIVYSSKAPSPSVAADHTVSSSDPATSDVGPGAQASSASPQATAQPSATPSASVALSAAPSAVGMPALGGVRPNRPVRQQGGGKPNCSPPYVVDPDGKKTYKRECL